MSGTVVGLDIGTTFVKVAIGEIDDNNNVEIIGYAKKPASGLRNGVIVNIDAAVEAIKSAVEAAEQMAGTEVTDVYTAIGAQQVESRNSEGDVVVDTTNKLRTLEITPEVVSRAIESAKAVQIPMDKRGLSIIPQEYVIDDLPGTPEPLGMQGKRLKVKVHIITASITACTNLEQCIDRAGFMLNDISSKTLVASLATITKDEMGLGSILIDMGGGSTDVMVLNNGAPVYMTSIPVGGNLVTNDIAVVEGIPFASAEKVKIEKGCCWIQGDEDSEPVIIPGSGAMPPVETTQYELCEIIRPRIEQIFEMAREDIVHHANLVRLNGSIVLTGGGALMPGIVQLTQEYWGTTSVRIGEVVKLGDAEAGYRKPDFATAVGLVLSNKDTIVPAKSKKRKNVDRESASKFGETVKNLFKKFF